MQPFDGTSDARTSNNTVRHQYRQLTENEKTDVSAVKAAGEEFLRQIDTVQSHYLAGQSPGRELALARTKVEEAVMWAVKGITR